MVQEPVTDDAEQALTDTVLTFEVKIDTRSGEYQRLKYIQKLTYIEDIPQILLGCVNIAYDHCFLEMGENLSEKAKRKLEERLK